MMNTQNKTTQKPSATAEKITQPNMQQLIQNQNELATFWGGNVGMLSRIQQLETYSQQLEAERDELLEALRAMIDMATDNRTHGVEIDKACAAIAKAERGAQ